VNIDVGHLFQNLCLPGNPGIKDKKGNFVVPDQRKDEVFFIGR